MNENGRKKLSQVAKGRKILKGATKINSERKN